MKNTKILATVVAALYVVLVFGTVMLWVGAYVAKRVL